MSKALTLVPGSLSDVMQRAGGSLAEAFVSCEAIVVVDCSGSMEAHDARGDLSRYEVACEELAALQAAMPGRLGVVAFSDNTVFVPGGVPPQMHGSTDLAGALRFVKLADRAGVRVIVVSDGEPDDPQEALQVASKYENRIDGVFVGPERYPQGRDFLERLTQASGGRTYTADRADLLAEKITLLLTGG